MSVKKKMSFIRKVTNFTLVVFLSLISILIFSTCKSESKVDVKENSKNNSSTTESSKAAEKGREQQMKLTRKPAVAGAFYPAEPNVLRQTVSGYINDAKVENVDSKLMGLIAPHAGYVYSGAVAGYSYKAIKNPDDIETIILMGPSHRAAFVGISVFPGGVYQTPLGELTIDDEIAGEFLSANENIRYIPQADTLEHSIEVQLPFIQTVFKNVKIVVAIFGSPDQGADESFIKKAVEIAAKKKVLFIASSDFSHYYDYKTAQSMDKSGIESILKMSDVELLHKNYKKESELCGIYPVLTLIKIMNRIGGTDARLLKSANSGDVPVGDKAQVVGYASVAFYESDKKSKKEEVKSDVPDDKKLNKDEKKKLLKIARDTVYEYVKTKKRYKPASITEEKLLTKNGAFVTIKEKGELRGCIGNFVSDKPLYETIIDMAISAATQDPRFPPIVEKELDKLELEISVLSPLRKISDVNEIEVGKHGIYIIKGYNRGVLLPQVATEYGWDRLTFLEQTCRKAGLGKNEWKEGADIMIFDAQVFSEGEL